MSQARPRRFEKIGRVIALPFHQLFDGARIQATGKRGHPGSTDVIIEYDRLVASGRPRLTLEGGRPVETIKGRYERHRFELFGARFYARIGAFGGASSAAPSSHERHAVNVFAFDLRDRVPLLVFLPETLSSGALTLHISGTHFNDRKLKVRAVKTTLVRRCAATPPDRDAPLWRGLIAHGKYGGDPVAVQIDHRFLRSRLFIGDIETQTTKRPDVDLVLNLGGTPSRWVASEGLTEGDRHVERGEGTVGMDPAEIDEEVAWVLEHLRAGRRVLVHCEAGRNRSATVCCATLMALEGISPEEALARVRERHPWAHPDPYHWLALRWIAGRSTP